MRDVLPELVGWWREGRTVGLATVIATWRSAPRQPGAAMLLGPMSRKASISARAARPASAA